MRRCGRHPNVVQLHEVVWVKPDEHNAFGEANLVMDLAAGGGLFERLVSEGAYTEQLASAIMQQAARAVYHLHSRGILHRDIKPENVVCTPQPRPHSTRLRADSRRLPPSLPTHHPAPPSLLRSRDERRRLVGAAHRLWHRRRARGRARKGARARSLFPPLPCRRRPVQHLRGPSPPPPGAVAYTSALISRAGAVLFGTALCAGEDENHATPHRPLMRPAPIPSSPGARGRPDRHVVVLGSRDDAAAAVQPHGQSGPLGMGHGWPLRAPQAVSEGLRLLYALGRRGMAAQTTAGSDGSSTRGRPS